MNKYIFIKKEKTATVTELRPSDAYTSVNRVGLNTLLK